MAILNALNVRSLVIRSDMAQPTIRRLNRSKMTAR
jgi:hypothetical protein